MKTNLIKEKIRSIIKYNLNEVLVEIIPFGAKNMSEALQLNGFSINKSNSSEPIKTHFFNIGQNNELSESIDIEEFDDKGGVITFSTEVNAVKSSDNKLLNIIQNKIESIKNKINLNKKINTVLSKHDDVYGVSIGNFIKGRYKANDGKLYDEKSLSIEIIGVNSEVLNNVAKDLANTFNQESVLVKNYETNKIYLVKK